MEQIRTKNNERKKGINNENEGGKEEEELRIKRKEGGKEELRIKRKEGGKNLEEAGLGRKWTEGEGQRTCKVS